MTKRLFKTCHALAALILLTGCGQDRTQEFEQLVGENYWIHNVMQTHYLWADSVQAIKDKDYFAKTAPFFEKLLYKKAFGGAGDHISTLARKDSTASTSAQEGAILSTGLVYALMDNPVEKGGSPVARVLLVVPNSPAAQAGLQRGDWILQVNGHPLSAAQAPTLQTVGGNMLVTRPQLGKNGTMTWGTTKSVTVAARSLHPHPIVLTKTYTLPTDPAPIGYLFLAQGADTEPTPADEQALTETIRQAIRTLKGQHIRKLVLDLRYCTGGYVPSMNVLTSSLLPSGAKGHDFVRYRYQKRMHDAPASLPFSAEDLEASLAPERIYLLVGRDTRQSAEWLIQALKAELGKDQVMLIGDPTPGIYYLQGTYTDSRYAYIVKPVIAIVTNGKDVHAMGKGFEPDIALSEHAHGPDMYELGDVRETLLAQALSLIAQGHKP